MEAIPEQTLGTLPSPANALLTPPPPVRAISRSKTGRKPQRSSPLAGPAVSITDDEDGISTLLRASSSASLNRDSHFLSPPTPRQLVLSNPTRPKSMHSTLSLNSQSLTTLRDRSQAPGTKQPIRPISAILPSTATPQVHFADFSHSAGELRRFEEQTHQRYRPTPSRVSNRPVSALVNQPLRPPTIMLNEKSIEVPQMPFPPPPARPPRTADSAKPRDNSWYITNEYEQTPRFSRLSLAADNVVLPISAKQYKKCHHQQHPTPPSSATQSLRESPSVISLASTTTSSGGNRRSFLMDSLASTLKFARPNTKRGPSDHQEPSSHPPSSATQPSLSSRASNIFPDSDSSPASSSASSSLSPKSSLSRTRTNSFTDSSSSFMPDIVASSSQTSFNEERIPELPPLVHGKHTKRVETMLPSVAAGKEHSKNLLISKTKRRTAASANPGRVGDVVVNKDEKLRRGGTFRKFMRLFVSS